MNTPFEFKEMDLDRMVYVRAVDVADLPEDVQDQADGFDRVYAVHNAEGERLALRPRGRPARAPSSPTT